MDVLRREFGFRYRSCASNSEIFNQEALNGYGKRVLTLSDSGEVPWDKLAGVSRKPFHS